MKHSSYLLLLSIILFLFSCSVEKRLYLPGFYVSNKSIKQDASKKFPANEKSNEVIANSTEKLEGALADDKISSDAQKSISQIKTESVSEIEINPSKAIAAAPKRSSIVSTIVKTTTSKVSKARSRDYEDVLILLGLVIGFSGVILIVISAALMSSNPPLSTMLFAIGIVLLIVGIITAGIGDPSIFLDVLLGILDAL
jgi:hypothetical protein